jgi:hypothetical protein
MPYVPLTQLNASYHSRASLLGLSTLIRGLTLVLLNVFPPESRHCQEQFWKLGV